MPEQTMPTEATIRRELGYELHDCRTTHGGWCWQDQQSDTLDHRTGKRHFPTKLEAIKTLVAEAHDGQFLSRGQGEPVSGERGRSSDDA